MGSQRVSLVKAISYSEVTAFLESLDRWGVAPADIARARQDAKKMAAIAGQMIGELPAERFYCEIKLAGDVLSTLARRCLYEDGCHFLSGLLGYTEERLMLLPNFCPRHLQEVKRLLARLGYELPLNYEAWRRQTLSEFPTREERNSVLWWHWSLGCCGKVTKESVALLQEHGITTIRDFRELLAGEYPPGFASDEPHRSALMSVGAELRAHTLKKKES